MSDIPEENLDKPALNLIQGIRDGSIDPSTLTKDQRLQCVETLYTEGYSPSQMAQLLERSEKTIRRDLMDVHKKNSLNPSPEFARQLIGKFLMKSEAHQMRLMRLARSSDGPAGVKVEAEVAAFQVLLKSMQLLQSLGYLPLRALQIAGDVTHHINVEDSERPLEEIGRTIQEVTAIGEETKTLTPELAGRIVALQQRLEKARLSEDAQKLLEYQQKISDEKEITNE